MLNSHFSDVISYATGQSLSTILSPIVGVSDRTLRKNVDSVSRDTINTVNERYREYVGRHEGVSKYALDLNKPGMICTGLVVGLERPRITYENTIALAVRIDAVSYGLTEARARDDVAGFKRILLEKDGADLVEHLSFSEGVDVSKAANQVHQAKGWKDLESPVAGLACHCMFSLLSLWDIEFSRQYFPEFKAHPCFSMVLPRLDPKVRCMEGEQREERRDMIWKPMRRLIDVLFCIGERVRTGDWPERAPQVKEIAFQTGYDQRAVTKWRYGSKHLLNRDLRNIWSSVCGKDARDTNDGYYPPVPMYYAAILWQQRAVKKDVVTYLYENYWADQRAHLEAKGFSFGTVPWPDCFNKI